MVLKEYELLQIDEAYLRDLQEKDPAALARLSLKLADDLKEAWDRMNQNSSNSSRPSGSEAPWASSKDGDSDVEDGEDNNDDEFAADTTANDDQSASTDYPPAEGDLDKAGSQKQTQQTSSGRPPGRQVGSTGFGRSQQLAVTAIKLHFSEHCTGCGVALAEEEQQAWAGFYCVDLVFGEVAAAGLQLSNTLNRYYHGHCPACGLENRTEPYRHPPDSLEWDKVELSEWRLIGPSLAALISYLCMDMRLTRRKVAVFMNDLLGLQISVGSIQNCIVESARALSPVEEEIVKDVLENDLLHADETSHKEAGALLWLWVFVTTTTALFLVGKRSKEIWCNLVDSFEGGFQGWLMTDGYKVYRQYSRRLRCWAHLIRKAKGLGDSYDREVRGYGHQLKALLDKLMEAVYQAREGPEAGKVSITARHQETVEKIRRLCEAMKKSTHKKTRELGGEFLNDWEAIFRILDYPAWPLTNNEAERALRHWVILRRITQGTRSGQGSRALALFASVITTCRLRKASPLLYMRDVIQARRAGLEAPALPAIPAEIGLGV